jgi:catechol 2,3-dioxygenase-like lactoylglutathione lyase family enzyme
MRKQQTMIVGMNHFTVIAEEPKATLDFYVGLLGLREGPRPDLGFQAPGCTRRACRGRSCTCTSTVRCRASGPASSTTWRSVRRTSRAVKARLDERGHKYDLRRQAGAGTWQLFTFDPNGAKVELDFDPAETL